MTPQPLTLAVLGQTPVKSTAYRWARDARKSHKSDCHIAGCVFIVIVSVEAGWYVVRYSVKDGAK